MATKKSPVEQRREDLKGYIDEAILKGHGSWFHPKTGQFNAFDVELVQDYCHSLGIEVAFDGGKSFSMKPYKPRKVEEEEWSKEFTPKKANWFVLWVNRLLYWVNK